MINLAELRVKISSNWLYRNVQLIATYYNARLYRLGVGIQYSCRGSEIHFIERQGSTSVSYVVIFDEPTGYKRTALPARLVNCTTEDEGIRFFKNHKYLSCYKTSEDLEDPYVEVGFSELDSSLKLTGRGFGSAHLDGLTSDEDIIKRILVANILHDGISKGINKL